MCVSSTPPRSESASGRDGVVVVLAGDLDPAGGLVAHGVVAAVVAEAQLVGVAAEREPEDLVPETDPEHRRSTYQSTYRIDGSGHCGGITRTVGQEDTIRLTSEDVLRGRRRRNDFDATTHAEKMLQDGALDAEVVGDDAERRVVTAGDVGLGRGDGGDEVDAVGAARALDRVTHRGLVGAERTRERALVAQVAGEAAGVDAADPGHAVTHQQVVEAPLRAPVAVVRREVAHHDTCAERTVALGVVVVDAVVADVRVGEGDDLPGVRGIGHDLLVAGECGVEHQFAGRRRDRSTDRLTFELGAVGEDQDRVGHRVAFPSWTTTSPKRIVCLTFPRNARPANGVLRARLARPSGSTTHSCAGSNTVRFAGAHRRDRPSVGVQSGERRRTPRQRGQGIRQREVPGLHQLGEGDRQRRLQSEHARGRFLEGALLRLRRVGGVVGGDGVDGAVGESRTNGLDVGLGAQGRVHLEHRVEALATRVGEREVVRRALGRHRQPARLRRAHELDGAGGGAVEEVHGRAGHRAELDVARHDHRLRHRGPAGDAEPTRPRALVHVPARGEGLVLRVLRHDRAGQRRGVLERAVASRPHWPRRTRRR